MDTFKVRLLYEGLFELNLVSETNVQQDFCLLAQVERLSKSKTELCFRRRWRRGHTRYHIEHGS